ncbi:interferon-inducible GTPase 5-like isoform X2 [Ranitomeya imitator]|uniref:interferon-inducible GTPase 5-like isoform X2 n=1 Tax=Ranitomeya imitator TaxID=111125 RepID=UPI0037E85410
MDAKKQLSKGEIEIQTALEDGDLCKAADKVSDELNEIENAPLNIAITGESGTGKSTFINAIRSMGDEEEGSAQTGVVETTIKPTEYKHPQYPNVTFYDLPGIGTPNFLAENYLESLNFDQYDFFIIMSSQRFKQNDIELAKAINKKKKKFYFARTKVDADLYATRKQKKAYNEENILREIRDNCIECLEKGEIKEPKVFLISCLNDELHKYDFQKLQDTLIHELPDHKKHAFLLSLPNISKQIIEKKCMALKKEIWMLALASAGVAAIPIPGLSVVCDVAILITALKNYLKAFGLNERSLENLAKKFGKNVNDLRSVITSPLVTQTINTELILALLTKCASELMIIEELVSFIPVVGSIAAGGISFATTFKMLNISLQEIAEVAMRVLEKAFDTSV